jgi:Fe2+ or Zn2+ uptake regulation protein
VYNKNELKYVDIKYFVLYFPVRNNSEMNMRNTIIKKVKSKGLKLTPQRLAIIEAFAESALLHPSANTIYEKAKKKRAGIS